ncbi:MAG TPA: glutathione S-transferase N-terminal domain-containing protein, partial [Myxococcaceae bacterium]|nr:glutathione S-transferase N-terminal domain-containing protein [Myxococcaceae bacterium]
MIDLYTFTTPNGWKASIALEEMELPYRTHVIDITKGDQFSRDFVAVNPNSKIPA